MSKKIPIRVLGDEFEAVSEDSILRALQLYGYERGLPSYGFSRFCWNASCKQCVLRFECDGVTQSDFACQTDVKENMRLLSVPQVLMWKHKLKVRAGT